MSAPYGEHHTGAGLDAPLRNSGAHLNVTSKPRKAAKAAGASVLVALLDCVQVACILTVLAIQLSLAIQKVQAERKAAAACVRVPSGRATQTVAAPPPTVHNHVADFQPTFLVGALGAALLTKIFGPKECASIRCARCINVLRRSAR